MGRNLTVAAAVLAALLAAVPAVGDEPAKLSVLMLGDDGHHRPADLAKLITPILAKDGIDVRYTEDVDAALTPESLAKCDVLLIFRDHGDLPPKAETALMDFVEGGKGLFALDCASNCFRNSDKYTALVGGRFLRHDTGTFRAKIIDAQHPAMRGLSSFESWDETYVHDQFAPDIRVLMVREEQGGYEPYTWVRNQGNGRVFYTALGHDEHTWKNAGFQKLLEQGLRWAAGKIPEDKDVKPFEYVEANVPFYPPGEKWGTTSDQATRKMQLPLDPEQSMKHMHLPEGFEVQLFASDPDIYRPICMAWDARGRLWIAETVDYPNDKQPPGKGHDRIVILEDTKGTGKADKFTVFAEGLSIPTSMTFARGGVIVTQAPETLFLKDTDGDDKADVARDAVQRLGRTRHPRRAEQPALRLRQLGLGHGRLFRLQRQDRRQGGSVQPGNLAHETGRHGSGIPHIDQQQHLGPRPERDGRGFRVHGQQPAQRLPGRAEPLFRGGARLARRRQRGHRGPQEDPSGHGQGPASGLARRLHGGGRLRPLHRPQLPGGVRKQGGVRVRADGASGPRRLVESAGERFCRKRRLEHPGQRRRMDGAGLRRGRAGRRPVGDRLVQLHRPAQPDAEGVRDRQGRRLRHAAARQDARPHLPHRLQGRQALSQGGFHEGG